MNEHGMLPCPFCGEATNLEPDEAHGMTSFNAGCENCGALGPEQKFKWGNPSEDDIAQAVALWNKRA
jgi:Lar family restriction alleviation protein